MVDALRYLSGLEGGNTRQLITLLKGNSVPNLIICVNKMDEVKWKEDEFNKVRDVFESIFKSDKAVHINRIYVPMSAYNGQNLTEKIDVPWVTSNSFLQELLSLESPTMKYIDRPVRMTVKNMFKGGNNKKKGNVITVKVESGIVKNHVGEKFIIMPKEMIFSVKNMFREEEKIEFCKAGETVDLVVQMAKEEDFETIERGNIVCTSLYPIPMVQV